MIELPEAITIGWQGSEVGHRKRYFCGLYGDIYVCRRKEEHIGESVSGDGTADSRSWECQLL